VEKKEGLPVENQEGTGAHPVSDADKKTWEEPKLAFVEPKLTKHGDLEKVTGSKDGFFGQFSP
jgi:hypothetical protein